MATRTRQDMPFTSDPERRQRFLDYIADAHSTTEAAKRCGINRQTAYDLRIRDPQFAAAWDEAVKARGDFWEDRLRELGDRPKPDTLGVIIGLKKEGRFIEPQYLPRIAVSVRIDARPYESLSIEELRRQLAEAETEVLREEIEARGVIEGEVREIEIKVPALEEGESESEAVG